MTSLKKIGGGSTELQKFQQNVENAINPIIRKEIIDGVLLKNVTLEAQIATAIKHSLGRPVLGWHVARKRADARIWDIQDFNPNPSTTLMLTASHEVEIDIWIY